MRAIDPLDQATERTHEIIEDATKKIVAKANQPATPDTECVECLEPIHPARKKAVPHTKHCTECASLTEKH